MTEKMRQVVVRLPEELYQLAKDQAEENERPLAVELRRIIREALVS